MAVSLWQDPIQKRLAHNQPGTIGKRGALFLYLKDGCAL